jgi:hypothetical protein
MNAFAAAEQNGRAADLQEELEALFESQKTSEAKGATSDSRDLSARHRRPLSQAMGKTTLAVLRADRKH